MGNSENELQVTSGIKQYILQQFQRVKKDPNRSPTALTLSQILKTKHPEDFPFQFSHLGILYICDDDKDGLFSSKDLQNFALWIQINLPSIQMYEFQAQLQSRTVTKMIQDIEQKSLQSELLQWFNKMLLNSHRHKKIQNNYYLSIDSIKTIYEVFNVQLMADMDFQSFFYLVKKSSEEMGFKIEEVEDEQDEQYIALRVCEQFVKGFLKGVRKILKDIGYNNKYG